MSQPQEVMSGYPAVLSCGRDPVEPVVWTFQTSRDSVVENVETSERFGIRGSSLIISKVKAHDSGSYNCTDATNELHNTIQLIICGKLCKVTLL